MATVDGWRQRREVIDRLPHHTMRELDDLYEKRRVSLGVVRPSRVLDVRVSEEDRDWSPKQKHALAQRPLFVERKPLRKLPYRFHYAFQCKDSSDTYTKAIEDWELGTLFWKEVDRLGSERAAADSVRSKFLNELCREDKDTRFFMGTRHPFNEWLVLGVFWPPKPVERQPRLFQ
ncbi:MAG TPA: hypothetical protein VM098_00165 [Phycisphaerae bacterium]|nr:hypothetical protein [Phycisphaerae bacterium]